jgi:hypothetical protein
METAIPVTRKLVLGSSAAAVGLTALTLAMIPSAIRGIFSSGFLPHS